MKDDLEKRVNDFNSLCLPGQPMAMHMGTNYLVNDLWREVKRLRSNAQNMNSPRVVFTNVEDVTNKVCHWKKGESISTDGSASYATDCNICFGTSLPPSKGERCMFCGGVVIVDE